MYQQPGKLSDSFRKEGNYETESLLKRNNCENFRAKLHLRPLYDDTGCIQHIIVVIRDLSGQVNEGMPQGYSLPLPHDDRHDTIHTRHQHQVQ
jgi:hypothetical protein